MIEYKKYYEKRKSFAVVIYIIFILTVIDIFTTIIILNFGGYELNPIMSALFFMGYEYAFGVKFFITVTGLLGLLLIDRYIEREKDFPKYNKHKKFVLLFDFSVSVVCLIYTFVIVSNIIQIIKFLWG